MTEAGAHMMTEPQKIGQKNPIRAIFLPSLMPALYSSALHDETFLSSFLPVFDFAFVLVFVLASQTDAEWMFLFST